MRTVMTLSWIGVLACAACGGTAPPPFKPVADVKQLMQGAIDPNADIIWEATGTIVVESRHREPAPEEPGAVGCGAGQRDRADRGREPADDGAACEGWRHVDETVAGNDRYRPRRLESR